MGKVRVGYDRIKNYRDMKEQEQEKIGESKIWGYDRIKYE